MSLILALALPIAAGGLLARALAPSSGNRSADLAVVGSLAVGLGLGLSSCVYFLWACFARPYGISLLPIDAASCATFALIGSSVRGRPNMRPVVVDDSAPGMDRVILVAGSVLACGAAVALIGMLCHWPRGGFDDAFLMWNLHARVLFRDPTGWPEFFRGSPVDGAGFGFHTDYPLLLPASIARVWEMTGREMPVVGSAVAFLFTAAAAGLCYGAVAGFRGRAHGLLALMFLLGSPLFLKTGAKQIADLPLAFFILASVVAAQWLAESGWASVRAAVLAGLMAGLACWTKNEGLLFLPVLAATTAAAALCVRPVRSLGPASVGFVAGAATILAVVALFKLRFAPQNDLVAGQAAVPAWDRITDVSRHFAIGAAYLKEAWTLGKVLVLWPLLYLAAFGGRRASHPAGALSVGFGTCGLMLLGYYAVYLLTPHDLAWHLGSSVDRLLVHVLPAATVTFFLATGGPGTIQESELPGASPLEDFPRSAAA